MNQAEKDQKAAKHRDRAALYRADALYKRSHGAEAAAKKLEALASNNEVAARRLLG